MDEQRSESSRRDDIDRLALESCDREPIRVPGTIQPFGCLLASDLRLKEILFASANVEALLGVGAREAFALSPSDIVGSERVHLIRNLLSRSASRSRRLAAGTVDGARVPLDVFVHQSPDGLGILEFEPADGGGPQGEDSVEVLRRLFDRSAGSLPLEALLNASVERLRRLTGFDRVMAYQFESDGDGEVVAESIRLPKVGSFLGLRFPSWDIPRQARALMLEQPIRMLCDIDQEPIPILGRDDERDPVDLSFAHLRGVSKIHTEYLRNMGARATLTISLRVRDQLWGLLACHHLTPYVPSASIRSACDLFGQVTSMAIEIREQLALTERRVLVERTRSELADELAATEQLEDSAAGMLDLMRGALASDGAAFVREGRVVAVGATPPDASVVELIERLTPKASAGLLAIESFDRFEDALTDLDLGASAGCLLLIGDGRQVGDVVFFRKPKAEGIRWAGRPEKSIEEGPSGPRLTPRGSFELFTERNRGQCDRWSPEDLAAGSELRSILLDLGVQAEARATEARLTTVHRRRQDVLIAELNHRVKNILSVVRSVARRSQSDDVSIDAFVDRLDERIAAISASHDAAFRSAGRGVSLRQVLELQLGYAEGAGSSAVELTGPAVTLRSDVALALGLVVHELVTNAAKYGALSTPEGGVEVTWSLDRSGLHMVWREHDGPPVQEHSSRGFGYTLITRSIPYEFGGSVDYTMSREGVRFALDLPAELAFEAAVPDGETPATDTEVSEEPAARVSGIGSILIVEDNLVLAMDLSETLHAAGVESVELASTAATAEEILATTAIDVAILDMRLNAGTSLELARKLRRDGIPFLFATGYGSEFELPDDLAGATILTKPVSISALIASLRRLAE